VTVEERDRLIRQLDSAHAEMRAALAGAGPGTAANPDWSVKELVAHLAGWDAVTRDALLGHAGGAQAAIPARDGIHAYNARSVAARRGLTYDETLEDWERTREELRQALVALPADKLPVKLILPWGPKGTVARLVGSIAGHEREHAQELRAFMKGCE
jgi:uncharacterized protein (TIGR03083 family)